MVSASIWSAKSLGQYNSNRKTIPSCHKCISHVLAFVVYCGCDRMFPQWFSLGHKPIPVSYPERSAEYFQNKSLVFQDAEKLPKSGDQLGGDQQV